MTSSPPPLGSRILAALLGAVGVRRWLLAPSRLERWKRAPREAYRGEPPSSVRKVANVRRDEVDGMPVYQLTPLAGAEKQHVIYLHGGAYVLDFDPRMYWSVASELARRLGRTVSVPIYPVAPEHTHRDAFPPLIAHYRQLLTRHQPSEISFCGDSAGGGLALALCHALREAGLPQPSAVVLLSPWLELSLANPAVGEADRSDPLLNAAHLRECARLWAAGEPLDHPLLSPVNAPLAGLARITVFTGTRDVLNPDARLLRERARAQGVELGWHEAADRLHVWMFFPGRDARAAFDQVVEVLRAAG